MIFPRSFGKTAPIWSLVSLTLKASRLSLNQWFPKCGPWTTVSALLGNCKHKFLGPIPPTKSLKYFKSLLCTGLNLHILGLGPSKQLNKSPQWFLGTVGFENHGHKPHSTACMKTIAYMHGREYLSPVGIFSNLLCFYKGFLTNLCYW